MKKAFHDQSRALVQLATQNVIELDFEQAVRVIVETAANTLDVARTSVWLFNDKRTAIRCLDLHERASRTHSAGVELAQSDYPAYFAALSEERVIDASDAHADPRTSELAHLAALGAGAILDAPIRVQGKMVGVVCNEHVGGKREWTSQDQSFAGSIADICAMAIEAQRRRMLEEQLRQAQKMEAIGLLAGGISHDFNNLLTVIIGHADLALMLGSADDPGRSSLNEIRAAAESASALTRQLLAFSRRQAMQTRVLQLNDVMRSMMGMMTRLIGAHIKLELRLADDAWNVRADQSQLEQVCMNLLVNAKDAMPNGGVVQVETRNVSLEARRANAHMSVEPGEYVALSVSDEGAGMDEVTQLRIFEPFFTTKRPGQGTGLGLSTVYGIVKQSGGAVFVTSEIKKGSTFEILLPRSLELGHVASAPQPSGPAAHHAGESILLVEDDERVRALLCDVLRASGFQVMSATNAEEALAIASSNGAHFDLLVTDVMMPGMSGRDLAPVLKRLHPNVRVLFISGYSMDEMESLDGAYLQKPFVPAALVRRVREVLDT